MSAPPDIRSHCQLPFQVRPIHPTGGYINEGSLFPHFHIFRVDFGVSHVTKNPLKNNDLTYSILGFANIVCVVHWECLK